MKESILSIKSEKKTISNISFNISIDNSYCNKKWLILGSTILGAGVGLAMMPIYNKEVKNLENYGINVHNNSISFAISTVNTLVVAGISAGFYFYNYFFNYQQTKQEKVTKNQEIALNIGKSISVISSLIPVAMLWNIELNDQKIEGTSGFDQFIAWATFTSLPLAFLKTINNYNSIKNFLINKPDQSNNTELTNLGSKITVYGISGISLIGRGISLTNIFNEFQKQIGVDQDFNLPISIIAGGIIGNVALASSEYSNLKKLFLNTSELTCKKLILGVISALEGGWFTIPILSQGLEVTENWNNLLKSLIFFPFFISHMNTEASHLYNSITPEITLQIEEINEINLNGEYSSEIAFD